MSTGVKTGPFTDARPWFSVFVTGHADAVPARAPGDHPAAAAIRSYLDAVLWRRRRTHRLIVHSRGGRVEQAGVDRIVREFCESRGIPHVLEYASPDLFGPDAGFRRDMAAVANSHAVVWFGPRDADRDPVTLAIWHAIPYRVVPLTVHEPEGV